MEVPSQQSAHTTAFGSVMGHPALRPMLELWWANFMAGGYGPRCQAATESVGSRYAIVIDDGEPVMTHTITVCVAGRCHVLDLGRSDTQLAEADDLVAAIIAAEAARCERGIAEPVEVCDCADPVKQIVVARGPDHTWYLEHRPIQPQLFKRLVLDTDALRAAVALAAPTLPVRTSIGFLS
jgi:hypothetical protein